MVRELKDRTLEVSNNIDVRRFRGQCHGERSQRGSAIESGAAQACAGEKVREWLQEFVLTHERGTYVVHAIPFGRFRSLRAGPHSARRTAMFGMT